MNYIPDNWVVLKVNTKPNPHYRVLAGWSGGYTQGSSWRMNSGIVSVTMEDNYCLFKGFSGSVYQCHKDAYGLRTNNVGVVRQYEEERPGLVEVLPEETDWLNFEWKY